MLSNCATVSVLYRMLCGFVQWIELTLASMHATDGFIEKHHFVGIKYWRCLHSKYIQYRDYNSYKPRCHRQESGVHSTSAIHITLTTVFVAPKILKNKATDCTWMVSELSVALQEAYLYR